MLEIRNITKTYRSKTGESVKALDNVSVSFPESGMVFILGKSGSGKSTLLNVIGGLDSYDSGEFIIKGKSSKDFGGSDFDAYRNTFIGFIFQEYNVLDEFSVGANIALALELQGKKATPDKINEILSQVDLLSFAHRKPNELSGGQKQRVAIARALVKEPQIIMADEPTGALDSNTGKQIFDTLKALSREKLVLVVSHDRDFAERYADRIIELSDGRIISDVTKHEVASSRVSEGIDRVSSHILKIKGGYQLTAADVEMINAYLKNNKQDLILSGDTRVNEELRSAAGITEGGGTSVFESTNDQTDYKLQKYDAKQTKFIRSRLPMKNALKMGASGLKHKRFRLVLTILLSLVAFSMFGLADTMGAYDKIAAATRSMADSGIANASVVLGVRHTYHWGEESSSYYSPAAMNDADIKTLSEKTGLAFVPVFNGTTSSNSRQFPLEDNLKKAASLSGDAYEGCLYGYASLTAGDFENAGLRLVGRMPAADDEIVISEFIYRQLNLTGFKNDAKNESVAAGTLTMEESGENSIIGKHLCPDNSAFTSESKQLKVVGVVDTKFEYDRYKAFLPEDKPTVPNTGKENNDLTEMILLNELRDTLRYGFHTIGFVTQNYINTMAENMDRSGDRSLGVYTGNFNLGFYYATPGAEGSEPDKNTSSYGVGRVADSAAIAKLPVTFFDGVARTKLAENEYIVSQNMIESLCNGLGSVEFDDSTLRSAAETLLGRDLIEAAKAENPDANWNDVYRQAAIRKYAAEAVAAHKSEMIAHYGAGWADEGYEQELYSDVMNYNLWSSGSFRVKDAESIYSDFARKLAPAVASAFGVSCAADAPYPWVETLMEAQNGSASGALKMDFWTFSRLFDSYLLYKDITENNLLSHSALRKAIKDFDGNALPEDFDSRPEDDRYRIFASSYSMFIEKLNSGSNPAKYKNPYGSYLPSAAAKMAYARFLSMAGTQELRLKITTWKYDEYSGEGREQLVTTLTGCRVVGFFEDPNNNNSDLCVSETLSAKMTDLRAQSGEQSSWEEKAAHEDGIWSFAIAAMPKDHGTVRKLVELSYDGSGDLQFSLRNQVMNTLENFNSFIETGAKVFLYIGLGFAVFSALLLMNFISVSISYKKREIGILRAVGARSSDVFKIFFSESFIIAFINYVLSIIGTVTAIFFLNRWMRGEGINVTLLNFGVRQLLLMFAVSLLVAAVASFLPVWLIARKKPVDAIKDR